MESWVGFSPLSSRGSSFDVLRQNAPMCTCPFCSLIHVFKDFIHAENSSLEECFGNVFCGWLGLSSLSSSPSLPPSLPLFLTLSLPFSLSSRLFSSPLCISPLCWRPNTACDPTACDLCWRATKSRNRCRKMACETDGKWPAP